MNNILELKDIEPVMSKVYDCYNAHKIFLMGSFATYHLLPPELQDKYATTMDDHDIDVFIIGNTVTGVDKVLLAGYVGLEYKERDAAPQYYKMPGVRKIYSYTSCWHNLKYNFVFLSPDYYADFRDICSRAMGHSLAKCAFQYNSFDTLNPRPLISNKFIAFNRRREVEYNKDLLNDKALDKLANRAKALGFTLKNANKPLHSYPF